MSHVLPSLSMNTNCGSYGDYSLKGWERTSRYLGKYYGVAIEDSFKYELLGAWIVSVNGKRAICFSTYLIDNIYNVAKAWSEFLVNPADLDDLVKYALLSIARSQVAVFSVYFLQERGFELVKDCPGMSFAHIVSRNGNIKEIR